MTEGTYPKKEKKSVDIQFAVVKYRSETYLWAQKLNREDYGVDKKWVIFFLIRLRFEIIRMILTCVCERGTSLSFIKITQSLIY
jgi:hypothetical protein